MKKLIFIGIALIACLFTTVFAQMQWGVKAQDIPLQGETRGISKLARAMALRDTLLITEAYEVGSIPFKRPTLPKRRPTYINVYAMVVYEPDKKEEAIRGLYLSVSGGLGAFSFHLDFDEAEALSQALDKIMKLHRKLSRRKSFPDEFYIRFITRSGLGVELSRSKKEIAVFADGDVIGSLHTILSLESYRPHDMGVFYVEKEDEDYNVKPRLQFHSSKVARIRIEDTPKLKELIDKGCQILASIK